MTGATTAVSCKTEIDRFTEYYVAVFYWHYYYYEKHVGRVKVYKSKSTFFFLEKLIFVSVVSLLGLYWNDQQKTNYRAYKSRAVVGRLSTPV